MATHSSVLAWRIPGTGEPGGLLSMGSHRVGHDCSDLAAAAVKASRANMENPGEHKTNKLGWPWASRASCLFQVFPTACTSSGVCHFSLDQLWTSQHHKCCVP